MPLTSAVTLCQAKPITEQPRPAPPLLHAARLSTTGAFCGVRSLHLGWIVCGVVLLLGGGALLSPPASLHPHPASPSIPWWPSWRYVMAADSVTVKSEGSFAPSRLSSVTTSSDAAEVDAETKRWQQQYAKDVETEEQEERAAAHARQEREALRQRKLEEEEAKDEVNEDNDPHLLRRHSSPPVERGSSADEAERYTADHEFWVNAVESLPGSAFGFRMGERLPVTVYVRTQRRTGPASDLFSFMQEFLGGVDEGVREELLEMEIKKRERVREEGHRFSFSTTLSPATKKKASKVKKIKKRRAVQLTVDDDDDGEEEETKTNAVKKKAMRSSASRSLKNRTAHRSAKKWKKSPSNNDDDDEKEDEEVRGAANDVKGKQNQTQSKRTRVQDVGDEEEEPLSVHRTKGDLKAEEDDDAEEVDDVVSSSTRVDHVEEAEADEDVSDEEEDGRRRRTRATHPHQSSGKKSSLTTTTTTTTESPFSSDSEQRETAVKHYTRSPTSTLVPLSKDSNVEMELRFASAMRQRKTELVRSIPPAFEPRMGVNRKVHIPVEQWMLQAKNSMQPHQTYRHRWADVSDHNFDEVYGRTEEDEKRPPAESTIAFRFSVNGQRGTKKETTWFPLVTRLHRDTHVQQFGDVMHVGLRDRPDAFPVSPAEAAAAQQRESGKKSSPTSPADASEDPHLQNRRMVMRTKDELEREGPGSNVGQESAGKAPQLRYLSGLTFYFGFRSGVVNTVTSLQMRAQYSTTLPSELVMSYQWEEHRSFNPHYGITLVSVVSAVSSSVLLYVLLGGPSLSELGSYFVWYVSGRRKTAKRPSRPTVPPLGESELPGSASGGGLPATGIAEGGHLFPAPPPRVARNRVSRQFRKKLVALHHHED